jgi:hypothetical protein
MMVLDEYNAEIDEIDRDHVVLVVRALRLIVLGRTLDEAQQLAGAAIASRRPEGSQFWAQRGADLTGDEVPGALSEPPI